ncbi:hypothetical protein [Tepidicaulis sp.]|uniref:hypothetical protein n=1 Tax=Tepidicaulis sp. TaxID=1920809 RepID=UPI003B5CCD53
MRILFSALYAFAITLGAIYMPAIADEYGSASTEMNAQATVLPSSEEELKALHEQHLRELRRIGRQCSAGGPDVVIGGPCVIADMEAYIASGASPELKAFHNALSRDGKYDQNRSWALVKQRFKAQGTLAE